MTILEIFLFSGEQFLGSRIYSESVITVGRGSANLLTLDDRQISRLHASIRVDGARLFIRDEGSQIGTLVNGEPVKEQTFRETDTIEIGSFRLKVRRRSMKQQLDFDDEPTEAGQRRLSAEAREIPLHPTPAPRPVIGAIANPASAQPEAPTAPAPPPVAVEVAPPPPLTSPVVVRSPADVLRDSPREDLTAGLDDSSQQWSVPAAAAVSAPPPSGETPPAVAEFEHEPSTIRRVPEVVPVPEVVLVPETVPQQPAPAPLVVASTATRPMVAVPEPLPATEEEEDEDEDFVPSFSLLDMLDGDPLPASVQPGALLQLEVIHHRDGQVIDVRQVPRRRNFPPTGRRLIRLDGDERAQLAITEEVSGHVYLNNKAIPLEEIRQGARDRKGVALLEMRWGDRAAVTLTRPGLAGSQPVESHYHIRFVRMPEPPQQGARPVRSLLGAISNRYLLSAVALHAVLLGALSLVPTAEPQGAAEEARFAEVSLKAIQLEPPPEVKPEPPAPEPPAEKQPETKLPPRVVRPVKMTRARTHAPARPQKTGAESALAALEMIKPAETQGPALKDVVSNISAVSVPADARSRFKVGGAIGKLPIGEVRVSTAGVARDATSSSRELLSKENVGALKGAGGNGAVRGVVKKAPPAALQAAGSGRLSRAQIQKVINDHVAQVQSCYEKNLMRDHSLAGKITFDWVIAPSGSVASTRVRSSTMAGSAVSTCILQEMRTWIFPAPEGGSVLVTYPFIFSAQGF